MKVRADLTSAELEEIESVLDRVFRLETFWRDLGSWYDERERAVFSSASRLKPLKEATVRRKKGDRTPLVRTGSLRNATLAGNPVKANQREAFFGIPKGSRLRPVAVLHRDGARGKLKRNPVPPLTGKERDEIKDKLRDYILKEVDQ